MRDEPVPRCPRRELLDAECGTELEPTSDEQDGNPCGVVAQWRRLREQPSKHEEQARICEACPLNNGDLPPASTLYTNAVELLAELDMGLKIGKADVPPIVLEAAKIVKAEQASVRSEERRRDG